MKKQLSQMYVKIIGITILLFLVFSGLVGATHTPSGTPPVNNDANPCADILRGERIVSTTNYTGRTIVSTPSGIYVPVYDRAVVRAITKLGDLLIKTGDQLEEIQDISAENEFTNRKSMFYLKLLCEKEYEEDHTLQHAWADLIGEFVNETLVFVQEGYNKNPAFITSQTAYYQLVNMNVARIFMQDIVLSDIGTSTKRNIIRQITESLFVYDFPYTIGGMGSGFLPLSEDDLPNKLGREGGAGTPNDFKNSGEYDELSRLTLDEEGGDEEQTIMRALAAFNKRRATQIDNEKEKLNWGRGFFSYEICDLTIYNPVYDSNSTIDRNRQQDRRNCRIATPGSLIQDQTSFVFGSALRQMELNDEYEEWIAPNTLAVLSDVLSYRGITNTETRDESSYGITAKSPTELERVNIDSTIPAFTNRIVGGGSSVTNQQNAQGPIPHEFSNEINDTDWFSSWIFVDEFCFRSEALEDVPDAESCIE